MNDENERRAKRRQQWEKYTGWRVGESHPSRLPKLFQHRSRPRLSQSGSRLSQVGWPYTLNDGTRVAAFDHVYEIERPGWPKSLLTMPHSLNVKDARTLTQWCTEHGASWHADDDGWHMPGTLAILIIPFQVD